MNYHHLNRRVQRQQRLIGVLSFKVVALVVVAALLALKIFTHSYQVVLVPTSVSDGMVARGAVDKGYIEALALDAVYAMYNVSPQTVEYGRSVLERLSGPGERAAILVAYDRNATDIAERKITTIFFPRKIEHNFAAYEVVVDGVLGTYLETTQVTREDRRILIRFKPQAGSVRLASIGKLTED
ncbi:TraE/TraK family type IV conjugative transfer system protein [Pukyongiella litopenaei]|uniref:Conjugal transfer protein TraE n=1 Tax=Pukyongiella litopenaei TaxID=2605946 RepID=A0A5C2H3F8_9RHOB|nr:TraE/TraK family type IV conjugative transfer system protein [Pukyongiella litopenaei]QEP30436.1 hypothetical protein C6Y53_19660 [Pukyongiella litopenaei]